MVKINIYSKYFWLALALGLMFLDASCQISSTSGYQTSQSATVSPVLVAPEETRIVTSNYQTSQASTVPPVTVTTKDVSATATLIHDVPVLLEEKVFDYINGAILSPDGEKVLISWSTGAEPLHYKTTLYNLRTMKEMWTTDNFGENMAYSPDEKYVVSAARELVLLDAATGRPIKFKLGGNALLLFAFQPNYAGLFVGQTYPERLADSTTMISDWNISQDELTKVTEIKGYLSKLAIRSDGEVLALAIGGGGTHTVHFLDIKSKSEKCAVPGEAPWFLQSSKEVLILHDEMISIINSDTCELIESLDKITNVNGFVVSSDNNFIGTLEGDNTTLRVYSFKTQKISFTLYSERFVTGKFSFSADGNFILAVVLNDSTNNSVVRIWKIGKP